jgi:hypothetical protein
MTLWIECKKALATVAIAGLIGLTVWLQQAEIARQQAITLELTQEIGALKKLLAQQGYVARPLVDQRPSR